MSKILASGLHVIWSCVSRTYLKPTTLFLFSLWYNHTKLLTFHKHAKHFTTSKLLTCYSLFHKCSSPICSNGMSATSWVTAPMPILSREFSQLLSERAISWSYFTPVFCFSLFLSSVYYSILNWRLICVLLSFSLQCNPLRAGSVLCSLLHSQDLAPCPHKNALLNLCSVKKGISYCLVLGILHVLKKYL